MREIIELAAATLEALAVVIIAIAIVHGSVRFLVDLAGKSAVAYERYKIQLGKGLLLGLEFLVAADVVRTVILEPTLQNVMILGLLVVIRTFLSWSRDRRQVAVAEPRERGGTGRRGEQTPWTSSLVGCRTRSSVESMDR